MPPAWARWSTIGLIFCLVVVVPFVHYRDNYTHAKRLRVVTEGKFYRSGCLTASGFREAIERHGIKTVINLMEENQDPNLPEHYFGGQRIRESELCKSLGVDYRLILLDLKHPVSFLTERPECINNYLETMDKIEYPALIHCKAGLHRTGALVAIYRMEYEGWSVAEAMIELKSHGYGDKMATSYNPYIEQYVLKYQPGLRRSVAQR